MPDPDDPARIEWFSPDPRALLPLDDRFHVHRRLARTIRQGRFVCTVNQAFSAVMRGCADRKEGTWITGDFLAAYGRLHELGLAHSVEAWTADEITGGAPKRYAEGVELGGKGPGEDTPPPGTGAPAPSHDRR